ncbi:MAG: hypothetical protein ACLSA6_04520 [Holdemania massiliensis]
MVGFVWHTFSVIRNQKENYMKDVPFQLGQMLKLSDMLHKEYCFIVRNKEQNKSYPAQLIGNDLLFVMADNPLDGYQRLAERLRFIGLGLTLIKVNVKSG